MDFTANKKNSFAIAAGQWVGDIPGQGEARLRVRGLNSPVVRALRSLKERKVPRDQRERDGAIKAEPQFQIMREILHEAVLLDWDGYSLGGKPLPFSLETAGKYLLDPDFEAFADAVVWAANVVDQGRAEQEPLAKNSKAPSSGA